MAYYKKNPAHANVVDTGEEQHPTREDFDKNVHPDIQKERMQEREKKEKKEEHRAKLHETLEQQEEDREVRKQYKVKSASTKQSRPAGVIGNISRSAGHLVNAMPDWMLPPSGKKGKGNGMPIWMQGGFGGGKLPAWVMGGPAPWDPANPKSASPKKTRKVPQPKSNRPDWIRW